MEENNTQNEVLNKLFDFFKMSKEKEYDFSILNKEVNSDIPTPEISREDLNFSKTIYPTLDVNIEYLKSRFNTLINSDVVLRQFNLYARNKQYKALLLFIDGMVDTNLIDNFVLKPLMLKNDANSFDKNQERVISEAVTNNITVRKVKKFDIEEYILSSLLPQNSVVKETEFDKIVSGVNSGNCALFIDTLNIAFNIDVKGFKQRNVDTPNNESVIKGPQEAFVENIRVNTSLLRRIINNENLIIENIEIGKITKTKCSVCYMKNIANNDLVNEVKFRLNNLQVDSVNSAGYLEQLISDTNRYGVPELISTERPDKSADYLLARKSCYFIKWLTLFYNCTCNFNWFFIFTRG